MASAIRSVVSAMASLSAAVRLEVSMVVVSARHERGFTGAAAGVPCRSWIALPSWDDTLVSASRAAG
jgi:hypothetical protein